MREKVIELLEVTGAKDQMKVLMAQMMEQINSEIDTNIILEDSDFETLVEFVVPVYTKHYSEAELDGLIEFYKSDLGRALKDKAPLIARESMQAGQAASLILMQKWENQLND